MEFLKAAVNGFYSPRRKDEEHRPSIMWLWKQNLEREREGEKEEIIGKKNQGESPERFLLPTNWSAAHGASQNQSLPRFVLPWSLSLSLSLRMLYYSTLQLTFLWSHGISIHTSPLWYSLSTHTSDCLLFSPEKVNLHLHTDLPLHVCHIPWIRCCTQLLC